MLNSLYITYYLDIQNIIGAQMKIERNVLRMTYDIKIPKESLDRAFSSRDKYDELIADISKLIYNFYLNEKHGGVAEMSIIDIL